MQKWKTLMRSSPLRMAVCAAWMAAAFMGLEVFMRHYICHDLVYPLVFSAVWAVLLTAVILLFPPRGG